MKIFKFFLLSCLVTFGVVAIAQPSFKASVDTNRLLIGQHRTLTMELRYPKGTVAQLPIFSDTLMKGITLLDVKKPDTLASVNGMDGLKQQVVLTAFDSGTFVIPALMAGYYTKDVPTPSVLMSEAITLSVQTVAVDTTKAYRDISGIQKMPWSIKDYLPYFLIGLLVVGLVVGLLLLIMHRRGTINLLPEKRVILLPPDQEALNSLETLRYRKLWQNGEVKLFYTEIIDILRRYLLRQFNIQAAEMTSAEMLDALGMVKINSVAFEKIRSLFQMADLVKFAKLIPSPLENDTSINHAVDFVKESCPVQLIVESEEKENNRI